MWQLREAFAAVSAGIKNAPGLPPPPRPLRIPAWNVSVSDDAGEDREVMKSHPRPGALPNFPRGTTADALLKAARRHAYQANNA